MISSGVAVVSPAYVQQQNQFQNQQQEVGSKCTTVYVANLPTSADATRVRELFGDIGKVLHVKLLRDAVTGVSRGVGFVMFEDLETAQSACTARHRSSVDGHVLQVRIAERSAMHTSVEVHIRSSIVFLRNVPSTVATSDVSRFCSEAFGPVIEVILHPQSHSASGPSPCNAMFVAFESVDSACKCTEEVDGKQPFAAGPSQGEGATATANPQPSVPLITAKMVSDVAAEMRKTIVVRSTPPSADKSSANVTTTTQQQQQHQPFPQQFPDVQFLQPMMFPPAYVTNPPTVVPQMPPMVVPVMGPFMGGGSAPGGFAQPMILSGGVGGYIQAKQVHPQVHPQFVPICINSNHQQQQFSSPLGYQQQSPQQMVWVPVPNSTPPTAFHTPVTPGTGYIQWS